MHKAISVLFLLCVVGLSIYSFALIDPNLTLFSHPLWVSFRDPLVHLGYLMRETSSIIYISLLIILWGTHLVLLSSYKKIRVVTLAVLVGAILLLSNPIFSHDFFNYIFDAKILTYYGQNPYTTIPGSFPDDPWLRFMHWTHRPYPYGPSFLTLTLIPSFLGMGKFILHFALFKLLFVASYVLSVWLLAKIDKKGALFFATHPLILIEGIVNAHNDMIAVSLGIVGISFLFQNRTIVSRLFLVLAAGIKYLSAPIVILTKDNQKMNVLAFLGQVALILYLSFTREIHPWYFLPLFVFVPYFFKLMRSLHIFFFGLLLSYYPYIRYGNWDDRLLEMKHDIMITAAVLNTLYLVYVFLPEIRSYLRKK